MVSHDREGASKPHGEGVRLEDRRKREREPGRSARGIETWQQLRDHLATCWLVPIGTVGSSTVLRFIISSVRELRDPPMMRSRIASGTLRRPSPINTRGARSDEAHLASSARHPHTACSFLRAERARVLLRTAEIPRRVHMGVRQRGRPVPLNHGDPS